MKKSTAICNITDMVAIRCRVVGSHEPYKSHKENVICSLADGGLKCQDGCHDYEISVLCRCKYNAALRMVD